MVQQRKDGILRSLRFSFTVLKKELKESKGMSLENIIDCICKEATNKDSKKLEELLEQLYDYESAKILDI